MHHKIECFKAESTCKRKVKDNFGKHVLVNAAHTQRSTKRNEEQQRNCNELKFKRTKHTLLWLVFFVCFFLLSGVCIAKHDFFGKFIRRPPASRIVRWLFSFSVEEKRVGWAVMQPCCNWSHQTHVENYIGSCDVHLMCRKSEHFTYTIEFNAAQRVHWDYKRDVQSWHKWHLAFFCSLVSNTHTTNWSKTKWNETDANVSRIWYGSAMVQARLFSVDLSLSAFFFAHINGMGLELSRFQQFVELNRIIWMDLAQNLSELSDFNSEKPF